MRPTITMLLAALLLNACASISNFQKVESKIPCLGAIGKDKTSLFKKEFQKIGEPNLDAPLAVSVRSVPFNKNSFNSYKEYREQLGKKTTLTYIDSNLVKPRFYELKITDFVELKSQLNANTNSTLQEYLLNDKDQRVLIQVSFVASMEEAMQIDEAEHLFVVEQNGMLTLKAHNSYGNTIIKMSELQLFNFETAGFCWNNNTYGKPEIAVITPNGKSCPNSTEKNPEKLNDTKSYLRF